MDRTVLITGANSGIGLATAIELGRRGFRSVGSVRSAAKAKAVAAAAAQAGVEVETVLLDVTDAAGSARVIDGLRPWGLVNNAGYSATGAIEDVSDDEARLLLETMVVAPLRLARLALPGRHRRAADRAHGHGAADGGAGPAHAPRARPVGPPLRSPAPSVRVPSCPRPTTSCRRRRRSSPSRDAPGSSSRPSCPRSRCP